MKNIMHYNNKNDEVGLRETFWTLTEKYLQTTIDKFGTSFGGNVVSNSGPKDGGIPFVLTSSDIEMSDFKLNPFMAFAGGFPQILVQKKMYPPMPSNPDGTAKFAPYGLRKIESILIDEYGEDNVVVVQSRNLHRFIGPKTKMIGITTMDPLGIGFVSRTYTSLLGLNGKPSTMAEFEDLMKNPSIMSSAAMIIVGGSGAWQISEAKMEDHFGIDHIIVGQAEHSLLPIIKKILDGENVDPVQSTEAPNISEIPPIKKASIYGTVEIMRGCGRGCSFCSPTLRQRFSFPIDHILKEVELNAREGSRMIILQTDDLFLYGAKSSFLPNKKAIVDLIKAVSRVDGVEFIQAAHASLAPAVYDRSLMEEIAPMLIEKSIWTCRGDPCVSVEVGIETGSSRLMDQYMRGKMLPYKPEQWQDVVVKSIEIMNENEIYPLATLILGLPGEQPADVDATLELLERLSGMRLFYVPLLFTSEEESKLRESKHSNLKDLDKSQWEIISRCWKQNIDVWSPELSTKILLASILSYPLYRFKHGKKVFAPIMKISGLEEKLVGKRSGLGCQPDYCNVHPELTRENAPEELENSL